MDLIVQFISRTFFHDLIISGSIFLIILTVCLKDLKRFDGYIIRNHIYITSIISVFVGRPVPPRLNGNYIIQEEGPETLNRSPEQTSQRSNSSFE